MNVVGNQAGWDWSVSWSIDGDVRRQITARRSLILITFSKGNWLIKCRVFSHKFLEEKTLKNIFEQKKLRFQIT